MRDKDRVNTKGIAKSRGYAFINFTDHHHAIQGLKNTNNNLSLFNDGRVSYTFQKFCRTTSVV